MKEEMKAINIPLLVDTSTSDYDVTNGNQHEADDERPHIDDKFSSINPMLVFSAIIALLGSLAFGLNSGYSSPVQYEIIEELHLSTAEYSLFGSLSSIGGAIGSLVCGSVVDYVGRRRALGLGGVVSILGWCFIALAQDAWLLDVGRWLLGFALCIVSYAVPIYIAEFAPKNLRGGFVVLHVLMITIGTSVVFLLGLVTPWRTLALLGIIPSLVQFVGLFFIPESPRWLLMIGEDEGFETALQKFRGNGTDISKEVADIKVSAEALDEVQKVNILQLLQKKYAYTLTVGIGLSALPMLCGFNGILTYSRSIFESAGFSGIIGTVLMAILQLPSTMLGVALMDKCGRRPLLMISTVGLCLGCLLTGFAFILQDNHLLEGLSPYLAVTGILIYVAAYPIGLGGVSILIISEIYPLNIKGLCISMSALVASLSAWFVTYAINFSMEWSSSGTFFILAGVCVITLIFVVKLVPETKGKTLEEVHRMMGNFSE